MRCASSNGCNECAEHCADDGDDGGFGDSAGWGDTEYGNEEGVDALDLLEAPRKVEKISVTYSKASKQVCLLNPSINLRWLQQQLAVKNLYKLKTLLSLVAFACTTSAIVHDCIWALLPVCIL